MKGQSRQARNTVFSSTIYDIAEVQGRIWRVQRAILNPKTSRKDSLEGEGDGEGKEERARGGVSLQISGLDVAGLTFFELTILLGQSSKNTETTGCAQKIKSTGRRQTIIWRITRPSSYRATEVPGRATNSPR